MTAPGTGISAGTPARLRADGAAEARLHIQGVRGHRARHHRPGPSGIGPGPPKTGAATRGCLHPAEADEPGPPGGSRRATGLGRRAQAAGQGARRGLPASSRGRPTWAAGRKPTGDGPGPLRCPGRGARVPEEGAFAKRPSSALRTAVVAAVGCGRGAHATARTVLGRRERGRCRVRFRGRLPVPSARHGTARHLIKCPAGRCRPPRPPCRLLPPVPRRRAARPSFSHRRKGTDVR